MYSYPQYTQMTTIVPKPPNPERLLNLVLGYNSILEIGAGALFMFAPTMVYANPSHEVKQVAGFLANALFCIGVISALAIYLNVSLRIKRAMSMAFLLYNALISWMLIRVVFLERKTFDAAAMSMTSHILATALFASALYRTQNVTHLTHVAEKISAKIPSVGTVPQKEA